MISDGGPGVEIAQMKNKHGGMTTLEFFIISHLELLPSDALLGERRQYSLLFNRTTECGIEWE